MTKLDNMEAVFKALADKTQLRKLSLFMAAEVSVCHLHQSLKLAEPTTSRHLADRRRV